MADTSYTYSISADFPNQAVANGVFYEEILGSSITSAVILRVDTDGNDCLVWFDGPLSSGDETTLDGLVAAHQGVHPYESPDVTEDTHEALRQLIHFINGGPAEGFASGSYREVTGTDFPSAIIWYDSNGVGKKKIVEKLITYSGSFPATITWMMYDASETLLITVTDTLSYSGPFETSRLRVIS